MKSRYIAAVLISVISLGSLISYQAIKSAIHIPVLQPTAVGGTQCDNPTLDDGSETGQMALSGGADCTIADAVVMDANDKNGANYTSNGYTCKGKLQGSNSTWYAYWEANYYTYTCSNGSSQVAFNLQTEAQGEGDSGSQPSSSSPVVGGGGSSSSNTFTNGKLNPTPVGGTQCDNPTLDDGSETGQMALSGGADCTIADAVVMDANDKNGANYTSNGYTCTGTLQGDNTQWSTYWGGPFYSYTCADGSSQVAFNLQTEAQSGGGTATPDTVTNGTIERSVIQRYIHLLDWAGVQKKA